MSSKNNGNPVIDRGAGRNVNTVRSLDLVRQCFTQNVAYLLLDPPHREVLAYRHSKPPHWVADRVLAEGSLPTACHGNDERLLSAGYVTTQDCSGDIVSLREANLLVAVHLHCGDRAVTFHVSA